MIFIVVVLSDYKFTNENQIFLERYLERCPQGRYPYAFNQTTRLNIYKLAYLFAKYNIFVQMFRYF